MDLKNWKRWLPSWNPSLIAAVIGSAVAFALQQIGLVSLSPSAKALIVPAVGLLIGMIVNKNPDANAPIDKTGTTGESLAALITADVADVLDGHPELVHGLALLAVQRVIAEKLPEDAKKLEQLIEAALDKKPVAPLKPVLPPVKA